MRKDEHGEVSIAAIRTYGDTIHSFVERKNYQRHLPAGLQAGEPRFTARAGRACKYVDHCVGNVELGKMNDWVQVLRGRDGLPNSDLVRRQGHLAPSTRALMSKVMANGNEPHQVPDQRARRGQEEVADRGVPRLLRRPGRAAHRPGHRRHRAHRARRCRTAASSSCACRDLLRRPAGARRQDRRGPRRRSRSSASWSTATTKATCCRSSPSRWRTARRCSSRSSSARARRASARATSRRCSRRSSGSRRLRGNL